MFKTEAVRILLEGSTKWVTPYQVSGTPWGGSPYGTLLSFSKHTMVECSAEAESPS